MDTQGFDLEVFKGCSGVMEQIVLLQSELSLLPLYDNMPTWLDALQCYEQAGFHVSGMFPVNEDKGCVIEYDCLMKRLES